MTGVNLTEKEEAIIEEFRNKGIAPYSRSAIVRHALHVLAEVEGTGAETPKAKKDRKRSNLHPEMVVLKKGTPIMEVVPPLPATDCIHREDREEGTYCTRLKKIVEVGCNADCGGYKPRQST